MAALSYQVRTAGQRVADGVTNAVAEFGSFLVFAYKVLWHALIDVVLRLRYRKEVLRHTSDVMIGTGAYVIGGGQVFVVAALALFVGGTVGVQIFNGLQSLGAEKFTGLVGAFANTRELAPIIDAIALAAQMGSSFTAELGAMRISE